MKTVNEVSKLSGVSIRTLHYYDSIGLLVPTEITDAGYRLYDNGALERLQQILLFKELEFPLKEIKEILDSPNFNKEKALEQQIEILTMKKEHLEKLIDFARELKFNGGNVMDFKAFDTKKMDEYKKQAKENWGETRAYKEYEKKSEGRTKEDEQKIGKGLMNLFTEFGTMVELDESNEKVQAQVEKLQNYITEHYYTCTNEILLGLGMMYSAGGEMTENIDNAGGKGTASFVTKAISVYVDKK